MKNNLYPALCGISNYITKICSLFNLPFSPGSLVFQSQHFSQGERTTHSSRISHNYRISLGSRTIRHSLGFALIFILTLTLFCPPAHAQSPVNQIPVNRTIIKMPAIFSDNMVLQQKSNVPVWGRALPDQAVTVKASWGASASAVVQKDSLWMVRIKTPKAGGPYELSVKIGDSTIVYKNVLSGEVWLCSGQSNMEMPLEGWPPKDTVWTSPEEIKNAANPNIRLFSVARAYSDTKQFDCTGKWLVSSPETAAKFSAAGYFFGKKLNKELKIPIGLINTSWGGTPIESWISGDSLSALDEFKPFLEKLAKSHGDLNRLEQWLKGHPVVEINNKDIQNRWKGLDFQDSMCPQVSYNDSGWTEMNLPVVWENTSLGNFDGAGWFRKKIEIPKSWIGKELVVELGPIDDMDETFVNGQKVGGYMEDGNWQVERKYTVPALFVNDSILTIAVRVVDNQGGGGIYGKKEQMKVYLKEIEGSILSGTISTPNTTTGNTNAANSSLSSGSVSTQSITSGDISTGTISLAGAWKFLPVAEFKDNKFYVFGAKGEEYNTRPRMTVDLSAYVSTALYNAMIAPLAPYSIKGAIWYQGESNTDNPKLYKTMFPMMINNWRQAFSAQHKVLNSEKAQGSKSNAQRPDDFSFYFVQIAPYNYGEQTHSERLREAQMLTLSVPKTGMAVTMDIGNVNNIHPGDKKDVGQRLAFWALAKDYGRKITCSGPLYKSMSVKKDKIVLSFDHADGGLEIKERNGENNFLIAGKDGVFFKADVKVSGKKLIVSSPVVKEPAYVRYAWSNVSEGTLFNKAGLPASSFRTDDLEEGKAQVNAAIKTEEKKQ